VPPPAPPRTEAAGRQYAFTFRDGPERPHPDRGVPVARLEPVPGSIRGGGALESLVRSGVVGPARKVLSLDALKRLDRPALPVRVSAAAAVVAEREEGY
jgi:hypothetical protein